MEFACQRHRRDRERGIALILVLGFLAVAAVMIVHLTTASEVANLESKVLVVRNRLRFEAESACARAFWLTLMYRNRNPGGVLGQPSANPTEDEGERWRADGAVKSWDGNDCRIQVRVGDADAGLDFSGPNPVTKLRSMPAFRADDIELQQVFDRFLDELADYIDRDDLTRLQGRETADYRADGEPDMPRNGPLEFREEALWLDTADAFLAGGTPRRGAPPALASIRIIPPRGAAFKRGLKPAFFSADPNLIRQLTLLTDSELAEVLEARNAWQTGYVPLDQSLDPGLYSRLRARFSFRESGIYAVEATARRGDVVRVVRLVRDGRHSGLRFRASAPWIVNWARLVP